MPLCLMTTCEWIENRMQKDEITHSRHNRSSFYRRQLLLCSHIAMSLSSWNDKVIAPLAVLSLHRSKKPKTILLFLIGKNDFLNFQNVNLFSSACTRSLDVIRNENIHLSSAIKRNESDKKSYERFLQSFVHAFPWQMAKLLSLVCLNFSPLSVIRFRIIPFAYSRHPCRWHFHRSLCFTSSKTNWSLAAN